MRKFSKSCNAKVSLITGRRHGRGPVRTAQAHCSAQRRGGASRHASMSGQGRRAPSVEEVLLRRKAAAALSVMQNSTTPAPVAPPPTHLFAALSRNMTAPTHHLRASASTPALSESIAFGRRAPLPPSPAMTSTLRMARPPASFMAVPATAPALAGLSSSGMLRGHSSGGLMRPGLASASRRHPRTRRDSALPTTSFLCLSTHNCSPPLSSH